MKAIELANMILALPKEKQELPVGYMRYPVFESLLNAKFNEYKSIQHCFDITKAIEYLDLRIDAEE